MFALNNSKHLGQQGCLITCENENRILNIFYMRPKSFPFSCQLIRDVRGKLSGFTKRTYCCIMIGCGAFFFAFFFNVVHFNVFVNAEVCEETENGIIFRDPLKGTVSA